VLQLREEKKGDFDTADGDDGLLRLRWPECCRKVAETVDPWPAEVGGRFGPSRSRVRFPGVDVEAVTAAALRNKSSQALPRPGGASLRRRLAGPVAGFAKSLLPGWLTAVIIKTGLTR
jgi:hypothetical protein